MVNLLRLSACLFVLLSFNAFAVDTDGDGVDDANDNCPNVPNLECAFANNQYTCTRPDSDGDGIGDACDTFDVELNTFQNGEVADADEVNENFTNSIDGTDDGTAYWLAARDKKYLSNSTCYKIS